MAKRASARGIRRDVSGILRAPRRMKVADAVSSYMRVPMGAGKTTDAINVGDSGTATVTVAPAGATDKSFRVASSNPAIASVTADGSTLTYKGESAGTADIIVMTNDGQLIAQLQIVVS